MPSLLLMIFDDDCLLVADESTGFSSLHNQLLNDKKLIYQSGLLEENEFESQGAKERGVL